MLQQNRPDEISHVTVEPVTETGKANGYYDRKAAGRCTYPKCPKDAHDDGTLCRQHRDDKRARDRESQNARRADRRTRGICPRCGVHATDDYMCPACRVRYGRLNRARSSGESNREGNERDHLIERDGYARQRYYGRGRKGAPGLDEQDEFERRIIKRAVARYLEAAVFLSSPEAKALPKDERTKQRMEALSQLALATRAADDILDRHRFGEKQKAQRARDLAVQAREIVKSGR